VITTTDIRGKKRGGDFLKFFEIFLIGIFQVIMQFREYLSREPMVHEIPVLFRACLNQALQSRPLQEPEAPASLVNKVKRSNKIIPFSQSMMNMRGNRRNSQEMQMHMPIKFSTLDVRTLPV
jgi:hypothetical protein